MIPEFMINERGSVFCKYHPNYQIFNESVKELHNIQDLSLKAVKFHETRKIYHQVKSCETCDHFIQNNCYFSRDDIKRIKLKKNLRLYRCKFCGSSIDYVNNILYHKIAKEKYNVNVALICCLCHASLRSNDIKREFKIQNRDYFLKALIPLFLSFIPLYVMFRLPFEENVPIYPTLILGFIIFFGWSIISFMKILKLKYSLKRSKFFKDLLEDIQ